MKTWWGKHTLDEGQIGQWQIGSMDLWIAHRPGEWMVWTKQTRGPLDGSSSVECPATGAAPPNEAVLTRIIASPALHTFALVPAMADRPVVARPEEPLRLMPMQKTSLFVQTPVWLTVHLGETATPAVDVPLWRPSDTWFGTNFMEGDLCYSTRTRARLLLETVPLRPSRALTVINITHNGPEPLLLERLKLPMRHFSMFSSQDGRLWTDTVTVSTGRQSAGQISASLGEPPTKWAGLLSEISGPRQGLSGLGRVLSVLMN